ncbi:MAG: type II secretion system protein [Nitrospirae bacterium]|nr:type II secretion system protein [Nitrospirota bacterium]
MQNAKLRYFIIYNPRQAGFTLFEIMIALAIIGGVFVTILHTVSYHADIADKHSVNTRMLLLAKEKIAELELYPRNEKGDIPDTGYTYDNSVAPPDDEGISELKTIISGDGKSIVLSKLVMGKIPLTPQ